MSARLENFDYKMPYFYMVTIKASKKSSLNVPFSRVLDNGEVASTAVTLLFENVIAHFHETWWCIEPIRYYIIMPDHLHLIIKMRDVDGRVSVAVVVRQLMKALAATISQGNAAPSLQDRKVFLATGDYDAVVPTAPLDEFWVALGGESSCNVRKHYRTGHSIMGARRQLAKDLIGFIIGVNQTEESR